MSWSNNGDLLISCNPTLTVLDVESIVDFPSYSNILFSENVSIVRLLYFEAKY